MLFIAHPGQYSSLLFLHNYVRGKCSIVCSMFGNRLFTRHLEDDEELALIVHKHWVLGVSNLLWPFFAFIGGLLFLYMFPFKVMYYAAMLWSVVCVVWLLRNFYDYFLDAWIITDQGIIDVEWHGWFHRQSSRVLYSDIQGLSYEIEGVVGTVMRYGRISVEKISNGAVISLENVKNPKVVEALVLKKMEEYLHTKNLSDAKHVQNLISQIVANEMQLNQFDEDEEDDEEEEDEDDEDYDDE